MRKKLDVNALMKATAHRNYCRRIARHLIRTLMISPVLDLSLEFGLGRQHDNESVIAAWVGKRVPVGEAGNVQELRAELRGLLEQICEESS
ncbi:MAG: hypothetical protein EVA65_13500 [Oceanococcus sp.]|nr:MAG: hypothetical protein EVA65_13500 [Oceanococcus sp.]